MAFNYVHMTQFIHLFSAIFSLFIPLLIAVAFLTLVERKIPGAVQRRVGPDQVGFLGLLQPIADAAKLTFKETVVPNSSNYFLYFLAPILSSVLSLAIWAPIPIGVVGGLANIDLGVLYIFGLSSLSVYSIVLAGWSSGSRYAFSGALRSAAQMISYEVSFGLIIISVLMCVGSLSLSDIVTFQSTCIWLGIPLFPLSLVFFIPTLAETSRPPFDSPEAEAELVAGYNVEYSSIGFALSLIAEYANIIMMSTLNVILFWGGWSFPIGSFPPTLIFIFKIVIFVILLIWVRAVLPRYRYDQLMFLGRKVFLPISLTYIIFVSVILII